MHNCVTIALLQNKRCFMKKRLTITLSDSVLENLEKMAKEMGLSKSAMISVALENYKKGQVK